MEDSRSEEVSQERRVYALLRFKDYCHLYNKVGYKVVLYIDDEKLGPFPNRYGSIGTGIWISLRKNKI